MPDNNQHVPVRVATDQVKEIADAIQGGKSGSSPFRTLIERMEELIKQMRIEYKEAKSAGLVGQKGAKFQRELANKVKDPYTRKPGLIDKFFGWIEKTTGRDFSFDRNHPMSRAAEAFEKLQKHPAYEGIRGKGHMGLLEQLFGSTVAKKLSGSVGGAATTGATGTAAAAEGVSAAELAAGATGAFWAAEAATTMGRGFMEYIEGEMDLNWKTGAGKKFHAQALIGKSVAIAGGAAAGAYYGGTIGAAGGPIGAVGGTILGGILGWGVGKVVEMVGDAGQVFLDIEARMDKWSSDLLGRSFGQGQYSGAMRAVEANNQMRNIDMSIAEGDEMAISTESLSIADNIRKRADFHAKMRAQQKQNDEAIEAQIKQVQAMGAKGEISKEDADKLIKEARDEIEQLKKGGLQPKGMELEIIEAAKQIPWPATYGIGGDSEWGGGKGSGYTGGGGDF